jgi:CheY-like chemotaxis protein
VSLRILFADDSVTAQNMGKKILTEAGYEVIAVSNGAAAVKKIAEQKPDIIILDVYMPGYSGLEVCEKVRSNIATIKTPVLLTVGKMEPYKPEDANRVRADGVIIKPFEASDLLAIIKKFEERIKSMPAPAVMATTAPARKAVDLYPEPEHPEPARAKMMQPMVEVPDHMASSSAFSDLLGGDSNHSMPHFAAPAAAVPQADETTKLSAVPENDVPLSWRQDAEPQRPVIAAPAPDETSALEALSEPQAEATPELDSLPETEPAAESSPSPEAGSTIAEPTIAEPSMARPIQIPVYQDSEPADFMPTASAPTGDIDVAREPELQESAEEITRSTVADAREADLVPTSHAAHDATSAAPEQAAVHTNVAEMAVEAPADVDPSNSAVEPAMIESQSPDMAVEASAMETHEVQEPTAAVPGILSPTLTNDDFEARVAAAMAAYTHAQPASPAQSGASVNKNSLSEMPASAASASAPAIEELAVSTPVIHATHAADIEHGPEAASSAPAHIQAEAHSEVAATAEAVTARVEAELPAAISAVAEATEASGTEHHHIAQVVHRVMERMKGDLVEEIVRELKSKK